MVKGSYDGIGIDVNDIIVVGGLAVGGYFLYKTLSPISTSIGTLSQNLANQEKDFINQLSNVTGTFSDIISSDIKGINTTISNDINAVTSIPSTLSDWLSNFIKGFNQTKSGNTIVNNSPTGGGGSTSGTYSFNGQTYSGTPTLSQQTQMNKSASTPQTTALGQTFLNDVGLGSSTKILNSQIPVDNTNTVNTIIEGKSFTFPMLSQKVGGQWVTYEVNNTGSSLGVTKKNGQLWDPYTNLPVVYR